MTSLLLQNCNISSSGFPGFIKSVQVTSGLEKLAHIVPSVFKEGDKSLSNNYLWAHAFH